MISPNGIRWIVGIIALIAAACIVAPLFVEGLR